VEQAPPQWGRGTGRGNAPASGGAKAPPQTGDDYPASEGGEQSPPPRWCLRHGNADAAPAAHLKTHTTYDNTNNSRDPTPDTGHEETTTATTRRQ
jgi:hypothetical protein